MIVGLRAPMPPSSNNAYRAVGNHVTRSEENNLYRRRFARVVQEANPHLLTVPDEFCDKRAAYGVVAAFYFAALRRKTQGKYTIYLKEDIDNRFKILGDCLKEVIGVDDANFFDVRLLKYQADAGEEPHVEVFIRKLEEE